MSQNHGGGSGRWKGEKIVKAERVSRNIDSSSFFSFSSGGFGRHKGVRVTTNEGNSYLIHHPGPSSTVTVADASNMSYKWKVDNTIRVKGNPTVQEAYKGAGGKTNIPIINYLTACTCWGAASGVQKTLEKG